MQAATADFKYIAAVAQSPLHPMPHQGILLHRRLLSTTAAGELHMVLIPS